MPGLLFLPLLLLAMAGPLEMSVRPGVEETFTATVSGRGGEIGPGEFRGILSLNGSPAEVPVAGRAQRSGARWRLPITLRYAEIPADWAERFQPGTFQYRLTRRVAGQPEVEWSGAQRWDAVTVEGERDVVSRFVKLRSIEITEMSFTESEARAVVAVRNPFRFPLKVASTHYRLSANDREVGNGATLGMLLRPEQVNTLLLPIAIDHGELVAAAGRAIVSGGQVQARLLGNLTIRLPRGDVLVPLDLSGEMSLGR